MKERPILFSGELVRAIIEGRKTVTRRVVKPAKDRNGSGCRLAPCEIAGEVNGGDYSLCPYGQPGDRLWVRETFMGPLIDEDGDYPDGYHSPEFCEYRADGVPAPEWVDVDGELHQGWKPSIFMPRWASRITLEIVSVRVERLQEISEKDAIAEGGPEDHPNGSACGWFEQLWESINGPGAWAANDWVWVIEFKRVEQARAAT